MTAKKYWKHVIHGPFYQNLEPGMTGTSIWAHHNEYGNGCTLGYHCINAPYGEPKAHSHNFHELICFIGGNPENINDLGAEIHIRIGEELEEHVFTTATMLSLPPGLQHGYLEVKNITRPFILLEISSTAEYGQPAETTGENG